MRHHLAILYPTYIQMILEGSKTVECRLTRYAIPPYGAVEPGDLLWLKDRCGPVRLVAEAAKVQTMRTLKWTALEQIRRQLNDQIRAEPAFWRAKRRAAYCTLIWLTDVQIVEPFRIAKTDPRAWVVLDGPLTPEQSISPPSPATS